MYMYMYMYIYIYITYNMAYILFILQVKYYIQISNICCLVSMHWFL